MCPIAIDIQDNLRAANEQVGGHILKTVQRRHTVFDERRPVIEFLQVGSLQRELVKALRQEPANSNHRRILQKRGDTWDSSKFLPKLLYDLIDVLSLGARFQVHENATLVAANRRTTRDDGGHEIHNIRVLLDNLHKGKLMLLH